jgi:hypothetical protein
LIDTAKTEEEANRILEKQSKINQDLVKEPLAKIAKLEKAIEARNRSVDIQKAKGFTPTLGFQKLAAHVDALNKADQKSIEVHQNDIKNFTNPLQIVPIGEKPVTAKKQVFYEDGKPIASFGDKYQAEQFGIMKLDDAILQQIIDSAPTTKGILPKRYAAFAAKEIERRAGKAPKGIEVKKSFYSDKVNEDFEKLQKTLLPALKRFGLDSVALRIVDSIADGKADGSYVKELIKIAYNAENPMGTLRHESIHALKELGAFTDAEWKVLSNKAKSDWIDKYIKKPNLYKSYQDAYKAENGNLNGFDEYTIEEAIAEAFSDFANTKPPAGLIGNIFYRLNKMFEALGNTFKRLGYTTANEIFAKVERGEAKPTRKAVSESEKFAKKEGDAPEGIPQSLWDLQKKMRDAESSARNWNYGASKRNLTMASRRLLQAAEKEYGSFEAAQPVLIRMNEESSKREEEYQLSGEKATPAEVKQADKYYEENGIYPYLSEGQLSVPVGEKFSIKAPSKEAGENDPATGLPLNKNGSVTLYYPTTQENVRRINNEKTLFADDKTESRIYLTNESSGWKTIGGMGNMPQETDGSVARVEIDPSMLQLDQEYEDGRKDFFVPIREGEYYNKKLRLWAMYAERSKPIPLATKYSELGKNFDKGIADYELLDAKEKKARLKEIRKLLKQEHNVGTLLSENGKLEKTKTGDYGLTYDDQSVASLGLGLASAQKLNDKVTTCPVSAICEGLCLGDTSGNNMMYGGMATGEIAQKLQTGKTSFRSGARLSQYLKTEAMIVHPQEFITLLHQEISNFEKWAKKNDYKPAIRLNVTSDIPPKYYKSLIDAHPDVMFYDYTKLDSKSVAPNHHLTYSSTGASQIVNGEEVKNTEQNWKKMRSRLDSGDNVAMAFTSKTDMPSEVIDAETGNTYQVWNGDNYDARFLDPMRDDGVGMIIGLTNKAATLKAPSAAKETNGFFIDYDKARDGDTVTIRNQNNLEKEEAPTRKVIPIKQERFQIKAPDTKEFKQWFGNSKVVDDAGNPLVVYHATTNFDGNEFKPSKKVNRSGNPDGYYFTYDIEDANRYAGEKEGAEIIPAFLSIKNPYPYGQRNVHTKAMVEQFEKELRNEVDLDRLGMGWYNEKVDTFKEGRFPNITFSTDAMTRVIQAGGYDGMIDGRDWVAFKPNQIKSAFNQKPTESADIRYQIKAPKTAEFEQWAEGTKVVNEDGSPKLVFTGTSKDNIFNAFRISKNGVWFSEDPQSASQYAVENDSMGYKDEGYSRGWERKLTKTNTASRVIPAFLNIKNPFKMTQEIFDEYLQTGEGQSYKRAQGNYFERLRSLGYDGVDMGDGVWVVLLEPNQIKSAFNEKPISSKNKFQIRAPQDFEVEETGRKDNLIFLLQDKQIDLKRIIDGLKAQGKEIADKWNAYLQEELFHGRSATRVKFFINRELNPLLGQMNSAGITLEQMDDYLLARHAKEANEYIRSINKDPNANAGMTDAEAEAYIKAIPPMRRQVFERLAGEVDKMTKETRQMMVDYGLETQATIDAWEKTYKNYVPLFREETEGSPISTGRGYSIRGSTTRSRTGSSKKVVDVLANVALQRERTIARGEKNRVGNALLGLILQNPNSDYWIAVNPDDVTQDDLRSELIAMGLDPDVADNLADKPKERKLNKDTGLYEYKTNPVWMQQPNVFMTRVNGQDRIMVFNENNERAARMAVIFNNLDQNQKGQALAMMGTAGQYFQEAINTVGKGTRYFAAINTQYNPAFSIYNFMRDVGGATLNLQSTALKGKEFEVISNAFTALKAVYQDLRLERSGQQANSKWAQIFEEFELEGGKTGFRDLFNDSETRARALESELEAFKQGGTRQKAKAVFDWLSDFNEAIENAIRVSAYKSAKDMGMSPQQAASLAKNLTVNFNRTGAMSKSFTTLYAFFNASVQGSARIAQTLMNSDGTLSSAGKMIVKGGITIGIMQAVMMATAGFEEDEPPDFVKDKNFVIPYGDKKYIAIPMPLGFNVIPSFGRRIAEFVMSTDKNVGKAVFEMGNMILDGFNPLGSATFAQTLTPTLIDPVIALGENKDFAGKPISRDDINSLNPTPGYTRGRDNASALSTGLAYAVNLLSGGTEFKKGVISPTPDQIDYLIGQVTGGVGREVLKVEKAIGATVKGEELATFNIPIVGRMVGDIKQKTVETSRFYDNIKSMNEHQQEIDGRLKQGEDIDSYLEKYPEAAMYKYADRVYNKINKLKQKRKALKESGGDDADLKAYDDAILEIMTNFNETLRDAKES